MNILKVAVDDCHPFLNIMGVSVWIKDLVGVMIDIYAVYVLLVYFLIAQL